MNQATEQRIGPGHTRRHVMRLGGVVISAAAVAGAVALAACGASETAGKEAGSGGPAVSKSRTPVTLRSWVATPGSETFPATEAADAAIKQKYPHITVIHEVRPPGDYIAAVVAAGAAGSLPDVIYAQGTQIQGFIQKGLTLTMDSYLAKDKDFDLKDFPPVALKLYARDGKQHAIPYDHGPQMLWYNKELFEKHGVKLPTSNWTMEDMLDAAKRLTNPADGQWGIVGMTPGPGWVMHGNHLKPFGGSLLNDAETETQIDSKESIEGLEWFARLRMVHKANPLPADLSGVQGGGSGLFRQGKVGMLDGGPWTFRSFKAAQINFTADIADWPKGPKGRFASSMGSGYPISKTTTHPDDAWLYESEYLGKDLERSLMGQFLKTGFGIPVRLSLMAKWETSKEFAPPNAKIVAPAASYSVIGLSITPIKADLDKIIGDAFAPVWQGTTTMAEAAREIKRLAQPLLEQNRRT